MRTRRVVGLIITVFVAILFVFAAYTAWQNAKVAESPLPMQQQANNLSGAVVQFHKDMGDWPFKLAYLNLPPNQWDLQPIGGTGKRIDPSSWKGPYLPALSVPKDFHGEIEYFDSEGLIWHVEYNHTKGSIALRNNNFPNVDHPIYIRPQEI